MGGLSTSLMYSAFESWMVTEYHKRQLPQLGTSLSSLFGIMATLNSIVAICSGVFSEWLVEVTHTKRAPFMASAALLSIAFWLILMTWVRPRARNSCGDSDVFRRKIMVTTTKQKNLRPPAQLLQQSSLRFGQFS